MITIRWRLNPEDSNPSRAFKFDENKCWKRAYIKGHDIVEMIAQDLWDLEALTVSKIYITEPEQYRGEYEIVSKFIPEFTANKILAEGEAPPDSRPRAKKH